MRRLAMGISVLAVAAAVAAALYLTLADFYTSQSCSMTAGSDRVVCTVSDGSTLLEENGRRVLWLLAVPIVATAGVAAVIASGLPAWPGWIVALLLLSASIMTALTIGLFFLPAALLSLLAMVLYGRARWHGTQGT